MDLNSISSARQLHEEFQLTQKKEAQKQKEVIDKAISQLGMYADILTNNCDAYSICASLLDNLKRGGINETSNNKV